MDDLICFLRMKAMTKFTTVKWPTSLMCQWNFVCLSVNDEKCVLSAVDVICPLVVVVRV